MALPLNGRSHDVLTHLGIPDRPFLGRTTKELCLLVGGLLAGLGALTQRGLPPLVGPAEGAAIALLCGAVAIVRPLDRSLLTWGRVAVAHASQARLHAWQPPTPSAPTLAATAAAVPPHLAALGALTEPGAPAGTGGADARGVVSPTAAPRTQDAPYVPVAIEHGIVTFADGSRCAVIECSGRDTSLMDPSGRQALHVGFHAFLLGLPCPIKFLTVSAPADLRAYTAIRTARLKGVPPGLRRLESADTAYMNRVVKRKNMLDHHTYGIIPLADGGATPRTPPLPVPLGRLRCGGPPAPAGAGLTDHDEQLLDERASASSPISSPPVSTPGDSTRPRSWGCGTGCCIRVARSFSRSPRCPKRRSPHPRSASRPRPRSRHETTCSAPSAPSTSRRDAVGGAGRRANVTHLHRRAHWGCAGPRARADRARPPPP